MAADALDQLGQQAAALLAQLSATERRKLAAELARTMRTTRQSGSAPTNGQTAPMAPRKRHAPSAAPFAARCSPNWSNRHGSRPVPPPQRPPLNSLAAPTGSPPSIAWLRDKINGKDVQYPERQLIGITDADIDRIEDRLIKSLTASL